MEQPSAAHWRAQPAAVPSVHPATIAPPYPKPVEIGPGGIIGGAPGGVGPKVGPGLKVAPPPKPIAPPITPAHQGFMRPKHLSMQLLNEVEHGGVQPLPFPGDLVGCGGGIG